MTNKKRELIEIILDNVKPEDWPEHLPYAAQDKASTGTAKSTIWFYQEKPVLSSINNHAWNSVPRSKYDNLMIDTCLCKHWNKTIVHRGEFMKRWNERNGPVELKTLTFSREGIDPVILTEKMEKISIKPDADSEGWIEWNGGEMPVEKGTLIDVKYRCGIVNLHVKAGELPGYGSITYRYAIDFKHDDNPDDDIIAYRLHVPQEQKTTQQVALEKFGTGWHENDGKTPPLPEGLTIDIEFKNGTIRTDRAKNDSDFDIPYYADEEFTIKRWRIHSVQVALLREPTPQCCEEIPCSFVDDKESKIDKSAKSFSKAIGKLNGVLPTAQQAADGFKKAAESIGSLVSGDTKKYRDVTPEMLECLSGEFEKTFSIKTNPATETQVGGNHYTKLAIQPMRYSMKNGLDPLQHTIIKYVTRFRDKAGIEDLEKAKHCIDMLIEYEKESK